MDKKRKVETPSGDLKRIKGPNNIVEVCLEKIAPIISNLFVEELDGVVVFIEELKKKARSLRDQKSPLAQLPVSVWEIIASNLCWNSRRCLALTCWQLNLTMKLPNVKACFFRPKFKIFYKNSKEILAKVTRESIGRYFLLTECGNFYFGLVIALTQRTCTMRMISLSVNSLYDHSESSIFRCVKPCCSIGTEKTMRFSITGDRLAHRKGVRIVAIYSKDVFYFIKNTKN